MKHPPFLPLGSFIYDRDAKESYEINSLLGQGGFAQCFSIRKLSTNEEFAAKIIRKSDLVRSKNKQKLLSEIKIHLSVKHKHIVKLFTYFEDKNFVYLIMEMCGNKSMMDLLKKRKKIEEKHVRVFLLQMLSALEYLHKDCSVVHRDMKLANLFLDKDFNLKVGDFGLAAVIDREERKKTICGTPNYIAPEVLFNSENGHSFEVDIWSVGVIVYTLIIGKPPFQKSDVKEIYKSIKSNTYSYPEDAIITPNAQYLITKLLELDPQKRWTIEQIYNSDFVREITSEKLPLLQQENIKASQETEHRTMQYKTNTPYSLQTEQQTMRPGTATKLGLLSAVHMNVLTLLYENMQQSSICSTYRNDYVLRTMTKMGKYGIGYFLASGAMGILFNDCTSIVLRKSAIDEIFQKNDIYSFEYMEHKIYGGQKIITKEKHTTTSAPSSLKKKILLIPYFISAFQEEMPVFPYKSQEEGVFVIKHVNFSKGPVLRLSNRTIVFIIDQQSIVFFNEGKSLYAEEKEKIDRSILLYCNEALKVLLKK
ncbi:polo-like kinase 1 [Nematocida sp. LUAm3]|nr:polo-like kinase 1 [Nematocida sp. LUAm3]KAI5174962.1 polo-like kinase 1 [Nematocida sp. LUAm2]KAI5177439.1 polo-like kinase 1 [Nematocida sp. LUAm1]